MKALAAIGEFITGHATWLVLAVGLLAGAAMGWSATDMVWKTKYALAEKDWTDQKAAQDRANLSHAEQTVAWERRSAELVAEADSAYQKGIEDGKKSLDADVAAIHDGSKRVRDKFRCPAPAKRPDPLPTPGPAPGGGDEAAQGGLQPADAEFLVRLGHEANDVVRQLTACQDYITQQQRPVSP
ncbi:lysis system i-spanin subunit Rz [Aeromonas hydrophila]|uniref:lysis system i-spanin subunit Rz n=1 Tax=Aeromonas hydrophila TaxID=644 RepID=UPI003D1C7C05